MIENLKGIHETVNYKKDTHLRLYMNNECEHYPPHWHTEIEILCPLDGGYSAICNHINYRLDTGDILFICPGTVHDLLAEPSGKRIIFQVGFGECHGFGELETALSLLSPCCLITSSGQAELYDRVYKRLLEITDLYLESPVMSETSIFARVFEIIALLGRNYSEPSGEPQHTPSYRSKYSEQMMGICGYISAHCAENLTLDQTAGMSGFSKYHFERIFKQYTGTSFYQYLTQKRLSMAEELLTDFSTTITEVAYRSGFSSGAAFARAFRLARQYTPSEYRELHNSNDMSTRAKRGRGQAQWSGSVSPDARSVEDASRDVKDCPVCFTSEYVNDHIIRIRGLLGASMYLVKGSKRALLIDTGSGIGNVRSYVDSLCGLPLTVMITHGHYDHTGGMFCFDEVYMNSEERIPTAESYSMGLIRASLSGSEFASSIPDELLVRPRLIQYKDLLDGMVFDLGGVHAEMICCPGHTIKTMAVLLNEDRLLITGDACHWISFMHFESCQPLSVFRSSLEKLQEREGEWDSLLFFHAMDKGSKELIPEMINRVDAVMSGLYDPDALTPEPHLWNGDNYSNVKGGRPILTPYDTSGRHFVAQKKGELASLLFDVKRLR